MDIYDIQSGFHIAIYVFILLAVAFLCASLIGILLGSKLLWCIIVALLCALLADFCVLIDAFIDIL